MKSIIKQLEKQLNKLKDLVEYRREFYKRRSVEWRSTSKGICYPIETSSIEYHVVEISNQIEQLKYHHLK